MKAKYTILTINHNITRIFWMLPGNYIIMSNCINFMVCNSCQTGKHGFQTFKQKPDLGFFFFFFSSQLNQCFEFSLNLVNQKWKVGHSRAEREFQATTRSSPETHLCLLIRQRKNVSQRIQLFFRQFQAQLNPAIILALFFHPVFIYLK